MKMVLDITYTRSMAPRPSTLPARSFELVDVSVNHNTVPALIDVSLVIPTSGTTAIAGANGSGKSTLLGVLAGVVSVGSGVVLRGEHAARGDRAERGEHAKRGAVALVVQRSSVPDGLPLTVLDAVRMGRWAQRGFWRPFTRTDHRIVDESLDRLGLGLLADRPLSALSGGQRQRTFVAQGLAQRAGILLLDEPTVGLDDLARELIATALDDEARRGTTVVHVTHDVDVMRRADRVIRLESGRVVDEVSVTTGR
jgi:zinc/manganese transport system ATP-binding protein